MDNADLLGKPCPVGHLVAPNRFLAQPLEHNQATPSGCFSDPLLAFYKRLRDGGWGAVVLETTAISTKEKCRQHALVLEDTPENAGSWEAFFKDMKAQGNDGANEGRTLWIVEISAAVHKNVSAQRRSAYPSQPDAQGLQVLTTDEMESLLTDHVTATRLAYERGADGIDFKQCHGYFGATLLRPGNQRDDRFGGNHDNRTCFLKEYTRRARKEIGDKEFLFTTRINAWDGGQAGGIGTGGSPADGTSCMVRDATEVDATYKLLVDLGYSLINVSAGIPTPSGMVNPAVHIPHEFYIFQDLALHAREVIHGTGNAPVAIASTAWSALGPLAPIIGDRYVAKGIDFIGFGRWQLCEPFLPRKVLFEAKKSNRPVPEYLEDNANVCLACGKCGSGLTGPGPVSCPIYG